MPRPKSIKTLNVRLLRKGWAPDAAFSPSFLVGQPRTLAQRPWDGVNGAALFIGQIYSNAPTWADFLAKGSADLPTDMITSGAGAVLFLPVEGRTVAVCFGHVHLALNDDAFERQFGLKVTLNTVPRGNLRTLDLATPDAVTFQKRVQASKDSDVQAFGVDMLRDLARVAGGTPRDRLFANFVAGKDAVSITCEVDPANVHEKCAEIVRAYRKREYRKEFDWVDNMRVVHEQDVIDKLDARLFEAVEDLRDGNVSDLHMAPPEIVNYTEGSELHYNGFGSHGTTFHSLSIDDYVSELERCGFDGGIADIKAGHRIKAKRSGEEQFSEKWRVYDCFVFETAMGAGASQKHYVLFAGEWYQVEKKFKSQIENFFDAIDKVEIIGATACSNEEELIADLHANRGDLLKLDREKINPARTRYANLEPCDFFSDERDFIHLKDGHSSGPISHLWSQGVVSAEAFISDGEFRKKLRAKVKSFGRGFEKYLPKSADRVVREDFRVVFGIMRKPYKDGSLGLPFFSKVSLQASAIRIRDQFGISVAIELIEKPASDAIDEEDGGEE